MTTTIKITPDLYPKLMKVIRLFATRVIQLTEDFYVDLDESAHFIELTNEQDEQMSWGVASVTEDLFNSGGHLIVTLWDETSDAEDGQEEVIKISINTDGVVTQL